MIFYNVEAEIIGARELVKQYKNNGAKSDSGVKRCKEFRETEQWKEFKELSAQYSEEFYQNSNGEIFIFAAGIKNKITILLGIISRRELDPNVQTAKFLDLIDAKFMDASIKEITLEAVYSLLEISHRNELIKDEDDVMEQFGLDDLLGRYSRSIKFKETILDICRQKQATLINKANILLCGETLMPEIERIYQAPSNTVWMGHPVHYMIQTSDPVVRERITDILLTALYTNNRIRSRRICHTRLHESTGLPTVFDKLYRSCNESAIIVSYNSDDDNDSEYANPSIDLIDGICDVVKKHKNNVLTILCLPRSSEKTKRAFMERLGSVTLVPLKEETVFGEKAKKYLRRLAKKQNVTGDKALYKAIPDIDKGYLAADLNIVFDDWYGKKLKTQVFPQYAAFESANKQMVRKKAKGSAYSDLKMMIGLAEVKDVITQALDFHKAQKLFKEKGISSENTARHMVFTGNPGTAKTTAARLFAQIMKDNGLLSEGRLYEVGRADLVGKYVGWTAQIVKSKFQAAKGSVLFIDEAYSLVDDKDGLFGDEAINTIVQEMENNREDMVVIFAGYPDKMEEFLRKNPGLKSRIAFHVPFKDYSPEELYQIMQLLAEKKKMTLTSDVEDKLLPVFAAHSKLEDFGNGRFVRNLLEKAQLKQASRLVALNPDSVTKEDVLTLTAEDFDTPEPPSVRKNVIGFV